MNANSDDSKANGDFCEQCGDADPTIRVMMAEYMLSAMQSFDSLKLDQISRIATEIAKTSINGINVHDGSQYLITSFGLPMFSGYKVLAYYYVAVKMACPELLPKLGLPYDNAYAMAERMFNGAKKK